MVAFKLPTSSVIFVRSVSRVVMHVFPAVHGAPTFGGGQFVIGGGGFALGGGTGGAIDGKYHITGAEGAAPI